MRGCSGCRRLRIRERTCSRKRSRPRSAANLPAAAAWSKPNHYRSAVHHRAPVLIGVLLGAVTAAAYLIGSNRSYGYDAAASFANFIATPSVWDAFAIHT